MIKIEIDIFDEELGDQHSVLVTSEVLDTKINPLLAKGWILTGKKTAESSDQIAISQGQVITFPYLEKKLEEEQYTKLLLKTPISAG
jgi:hypothetical protein